MCLSYFAQQIVQALSTTYKETISHGTWVYTAYSDFICTVSTLVVFMSPPAHFCQHFFFFW